MGGYNVPARCKVDVDTVATAERAVAGAGLVKATMQEAQVGSQWAETMFQHLLRGSALHPPLREAMEARVARCAGINPVTSMCRERLEALLGRGKATQVVVLAVLGIAWQSGVLAHEMERWLFGHESLDRQRVRYSVLVIIDHARDVLLYLGPA